MAASPLNPTPAGEPAPGQASILCRPQPAGQFTCWRCHTMDSADRFTYRNSDGTGLCQKCWGELVRDECPFCLGRFRDLREHLKSGECVEFSK